MPAIVDRSPGRLDLRSRQGDAFTFTFTVNFEATGFVWAAKLDRYGALVAAYTVTTVVGVGITTVTVTLLAVDTVDLVGWYDYDLEYSNGVTAPRTLLAGSHTFDPQVTT